MEAKATEAEKEAGKSALRTKRESKVKAEEYQRGLANCAAKDDEQCSAVKCVIGEFIFTGEKHCCQSA